MRGSIQMVSSWLQYGPNVKTYFRKGKKYWMSRGEENKKSEEQQGEQSLRSWYEEEVVQDAGADIPCSLWTKELSSWKCESSNGEKLFCTDCNTPQLAALVGQTEIKDWIWTWEGWRKSIICLSFCFPKKKLSAYLCIFI